MKRGGEDSSTNFFVYFCLLVPPESGPADKSHVIVVLALVRCWLSSDLVSTLLFEIL